MLLSILHLSDIHIKTRQDLVLRRAEAIAKATYTTPQRADIWVLLISGDIAFSGMPEEYEHAEKFIKEIAEFLRKQHTKSKIEILVVPGNHDCNFTLDNNARRLLLSQLLGQAEMVDSSVTETCLAVQEPFFRFMARVEALGKDGKPWLVRHRKFTTNTESVLFNCYNTAWMSQKREKLGDLIFPPQSPPTSTPVLSIGVFHHPLPWLKPENRRGFQSYLERFSDIIVTGHEHVSGQFAKRNRTGEAVEYCEGGALQPEVTSESEFNIIHVDTSDRIHQFIQYEWSEGMYRRKGGYDDWKPFVHGAARRARLTFTEEFETYLHDPGAQFTHPARERLTLEDIYVYPDLREMRIPPTNRQLLDIFKGKDISSKLVGDLRHVIVYGVDDSGKSSLAKAWCRDLTKREFAAILLSWQSISNSHAVALEHTIRNQERIQYGAMAAEEISQLPRDRRVVLVDDFHRLPIASRKQILEFLDANFGTIILLGGDILKFQEVSGGASLSEMFLEYRRFDLLPFGHVRRDKLIERWYDLSRQAGTDEATIARKTRETTAAINLSTRNNLVPSLPLFLLIIIQSYEAMSPLENPASGSGSYGYFHGRLIDRALSENDSPTDTDTSYKYLSELAYHMFQKRSRRLSQDELRQQHEAYCSIYRMSLSFDRMLRFLELSGVLQVSNGAQYSFKYKYLYHYFAARALAHDPQRFDTDSEGLINRLHHEESVSILMFLVHFVRGERILERIMAKAKLLYAEVTPCDLEKDVALFSKIEVKDTSLELPAGTTEDNRLSLLAAHDTTNPPEFVADGDDDDDDDVVEVNEIINVNAALKTIQVLGQIVKSFPGSTRGETKLAIIKECCSLALRATNAILAHVRENIEPTRKHLTERIKATGISEKEVGGKVDNVIYWTAELIALAFLLKTADAVGIQQLGQTYDDVIRDNPSLGVSLVDLAVRLEHFTSFPENKVNTLVKRTKDVRFTRGLLVRIVYRHFYLYKTDQSILDRFSSKLKIRRATPEPTRIEVRTRKR